MRDLTRTLTLILFLMVLFAGIWTTGCGRPAAVSEERSDSPVTVERVSLPPVPATPPMPVETAPDEAALPAGPRPFDGTDHGREARLAFERGEMATAVVHFDASLGEDETRSSERYLLGLALLREGRSERAVEELSRVVEEMPDAWKPRTNLTRALLAAGDVVAAREAARGAVELAPGEADAHQVLGRSLLEARLFEDAEDAFRQAVALDPGHAWAWNNLGYALIQSGRYEEAVEPLRRSLSLSPALAVAHNNLGVALERTGDLHGARDEYLAAVEQGAGSRASVSLARVQALLPAGNAAAADGSETALAEAEAPVEAEAGEPEKTSVEIESGSETTAEAETESTPERG
jgi:Flp pilus assembly protein TadD